MHVAVSLRGGDSGTIAAPLTDEVSMLYLGELGVLRGVSGREAVADAMQRPLTGWCACHDGLEALALQSLLDTTEI